MGLAASQARFLGLTARKSNVEYRGQQVNQARTALSNKVNGLFQEYDRLKAPVPPSKQDFVKIKYVVDTEGDDKYSIKNFSKIPSGEYEGYYNVTLEYQDKIPIIDTINVNDCILAVDKKDDGGYSFISFDIGKEKFVYDENDEAGSNITKIVVTGEEGDETIDKYQGLRAYMDRYNLTSGTFYMFMRNDMPHYTSENDLNNVEYSEIDGKQGYYGSYSFDYQRMKDEEYTIQTISAITQAKSGRMTDIKIISSDSDEIKDLIGYTFPIITSQADGEKEYDDAMNQYNYEKANYEKAVETINKKTEVLQRQDRSLELQLRQLDTEQKALSTEIEAVTNVLKETIESVFKTYE